MTPALCRRGTRRAVNGCARGVSMRRLMLNASRPDATVFPSLRWESGRNVYGCSCGLGAYDGSRASGDMPLFGARKPERAVLHLLQFVFVVLSELIVVSRADVISMAHNSDELSGGAADFVPGCAGRRTIAARTRTFSPGGMPSAAADPIEECSAAGSGRHGGFYSGDCAEVVARWASREGWGCACNVLFFRSARGNNSVDEDCAPR